MTTLKIAGVTDERDTCDCCGRTGLKRTVALENLDDGSVVFYGTTCAAVALGRDAKDVTRESKAAQRAKDAKAEAAKQAAHDVRMVQWVEFLRRKSGLSADVATMIQACGGFAAARAAYRAGRSE